MEALGCLQDPVFKIHLKGLFQFDINKYYVFLKRKRNFKFVPSIIHMKLDISIDLPQFYLYLYAYNHIVLFSSIQYTPVKRKKLVAKYTPVLNVMVAVVLFVEQDSNVWCAQIMISALLVKPKVYILSIRCSESVPLRLQVQVSW